MRPHGRQKWLLERFSQAIHKGRNITRKHSVYHKKISCLIWKKLHAFWKRTILPCSPTLSQPAWSYRLFPLLPPANIYDTAAARLNSEKSDLFFHVFLTSLPILYRILSEFLPTDDDKMCLDWLRNFYIALF